MGIPLSRWKREALAAPNMDVLQYALHLLNEGIVPYVFAAIRMAVHRVCVLQVEERGCREDSPAPDVVAHYNLTLKAYFERRMKSHRWLGGTKKSDIDRRAKILAEFIDECRDAGAKLAAQEAAKLAETMVTFRASVAGCPSVVKCVKVMETKNKITFLQPGLPAEICEAKESDKVAHFPTWAEAHEWAKAWAATQLVEARRVLQLAQTYDGAARGLKEGKKVKPAPHTIAFNEEQDMAAPPDIVPCAGTNCGSTNGVTHSTECNAQHAATIDGAKAGDEAAEAAQAQLATG